MRLMRRMLGRDRAFHILIVLLLGIGIGANTLVFSLVNELLLKPLPVADPKNLYLLQRMPANNFRPDPYFQYAHLREAVATNPAVSAAVAEQAIDSNSLVPMREGGGVRLISAQIVSPNYFRELGVRAALGRALDPGDGADVAVISHRFWQAQFAGDPGAVGRTLRLKDRTFTIIGVLPRDFHSVDIDRSPDVRLPLAAVDLFGGLDKVSFFIQARLAPGVAPERAVASLFAPLRSVRDPRDDDGSYQWTLMLTPLERGLSRMRDQFGGALWVLLGGVGLLLCAVAANVAGLLAAKSGERRREFGIRAALGAGRWRLARQVLVENLLLAAPGAVLGAALAWLLAPVVIGLLPPVRDFGQLASPQLLSARPDWRVLAFGAAVTIFAVVLSSLLPAWRASRWDLAPQMHRFSRAGRSAPVAIQAAFCVVLLSAAGLMGRSYTKLDRLDAGMDREHVASFTFDAAGNPPERAGRFFRDLRERVATLPGVRAAAWSARGVMRGVGIKMTVAPQGVVLPKSTFLNTSLHSVTPEFFEAVGMSLTAGQPLRAGQAEVRPTPIVVNEAFARQLFPQQDPIGRMVVQGTDGTKAPSRVIIGLVPTAKYRSMREPDPPTIYEALNPSLPHSALILYVRTQGPPAGTIGAVRQAATSLDPGIVLTEAATLDSEIRTSLWQERLVAILSAFFGLASAVLAGIGLYAALALSVAQRRKEFGIRVAVGAQARHVAQAVCGGMAAGVLLGAAAGLIGGYWLLRLTRSLLYGVEPFDAVSAGAAIAVLLAGSAMAAALPARKAASIDPATALREE